MERNYYTEGFESFLKEKADQYKLYPSEKVWSRINRRLHPRIKWSYLTVIILFLGLSTGLINSLVKQPINLPELITTSSQPVTEKNKNYLPGSEFIASKAENEHSTSQATVSDLNFDAKGTVVFPMAQTDTREAFVAVLMPETFVSFRQPENIFQNESVMEEYPDQTNSLEIAHNQLQSEDLSYMRLPSSLILATDNRMIEDRKVLKTPNVRDDKNFDIRNLIKGKWDIQFYFTPSVSYRKLKGNATKGTYSYSGIAYSANFGYPSDVNDAVTHTPSLGFEFGSAMIKNLGRNVRFKAGLQLNYNQYDVKAYSYVPELAPYGANFNGFIGSPVNLVSHYRNFDGYSPIWLKNKHFMISMPVGMEWSIIGNNKVQFNIAGSLQPTYNINNEAFLISTNLKNYAEEPSLYRKWNVNTAIETFLSLNTGSVKWVIGPQFRYQLLSTFRDKYPIKEHLLDYGIKVGVSKTLR